MLRRHASTLVLVVLAAIALVVVLVVDKGAVSTTEAEQRKRNLFDAWRRDDVSDVQLTSKGHEAHLVKTTSDAGDAIWDVEVDGQRWPADEQVVDQYLGTLEFATPERRVQAGAIDRAASGLDAPRVSVALSMGKLRYRLVVGGEAPTPTGARYAEVEGRGVVVITGELAAALEVEPSSFRSRSLVPYFSSDLSALSLDGEGGARHLVRAPWGGGRGAGFRLEGTPGDGGGRASGPALEKVLAGLGQLQVEEFLAPDVAEKALARRVTLTLSPKDAHAPRGRLELGGACPGHEDHVVAIRREPTPLHACVAKAGVEALTTPRAELVDRHLVGAPVDEIHSVELVMGDRKLEMARAGSAWHLRAPSDREVPADVGRSFVEGIAALEALRFVAADPAAVGLSPPRATARVVSPGGSDVDGGETDRVEVLEIGAEQPGASPSEGKVVHVRRVEDGAIAVIPASAAAALLPTDLALRARKVVDVPGRRFRALRVESSGHAQRVEREGEEAWKLLEPTGPGLRPDVGLVMDLAELVGSLSAERWVADKDDGSFGLDKPRFVIEAKVAPAREDADGGAPETLRIEIGAATTGGSYARREGEPAVFVASKNLEAAAGRLLLDRQALSFPLADVRKVVLRSGDRKLEVEHDGDTWRVPADAAKTAQAAAVRDALDDLLAEGAVSLGGPRPHEGIDHPQLEIVAERKDGAPVKITIGAGDSFRGTSVFYARRAGVDATFAVAQAKLRPLLDALGKGP